MPSDLDGLPLIYGTLKFRGFDEPYLTTLTGEGFDPCHILPGAVVIPLEMRREPSHLEACAELLAEVVRIRNLPTGEADLAMGDLLERNARVTQLLEEARIELSLARGKGWTSAMVAKEALRTGLLTLAVKMPDAMVRTTLGLEWEEQ